MSLLPLIATKTAGLPGETRHTQERLLNMCLLSQDAGDASSPAIVASTAGLTEASDLADLSGVSGAVHEMIRAGDTLFAVQGGHGFAQISSSNILKQTTTADHQNFDPVWIAATSGAVADCVVMSGGGNGVKQLAGGAGIAVSPLTVIGSLESLLNYVIASDNQTDRMARSDLADATTYGGSNFSSAETFPDNITRIIAVGTELWVFGTYYTEVWQYNPSLSNFPFSRIEGAVIESGCRKAKSVAKAKQLVYWLDPHGQVMRCQLGGAPQRISTEAVEQLIADRNLGSSISPKAFSFSERNHTYYALWFENDPALIYDVDLNYWHERSTGTEEGPWLISCAAEFRGFQYMGGTDGIIYYVDPSSHTDGDTVNLREVITAPLYASTDRESRLRKFAVSAKTGATDTGGDTSISLAQSVNGVDWGSEKTRNIGDVGDKDIKVTWRRLGEGRRRSMRLRYSGDAPMTYYGYEAEFY